MRIHFQGLIVQSRFDSDIDGKTIDIAVLIASANHHPVMSLNHSDVVSYTATPVITGNNVCFALQNQISNSTGVGTAQQLFLAAVPRLDNLRTGGGGIHRAIRNRSPHPNFHAYFELPRYGIMQTEDYFECQVIFGAEPFGCIGRTLSYSLSPLHNITFTIDDNNGQTNNQVVVLPSADVWITNRCSDERGTQSGCSGEVTDSHAEEYKKFFDPPAQAIAKIYRSGRCANGTPDPIRPTCTNPVSLDVDCSNTRFP